MLVPRFFFFNDTATTEIYTLSLHDALPISSDCSPIKSVTCQASAERHKPPTPELRVEVFAGRSLRRSWGTHTTAVRKAGRAHRRSEEHTSELQSRQYLVCRLLLEKKNNMRLVL